MRPWSATRPRGRQLAIAVVVLLAAVALALLPRPAVAAIGNQLRSHGTNLCLTTPAYREGVQLKLAPCGTGLNQRFALVGETIRPAYAQHLCLDLFGWRTDKGSAIVLWRCHGDLNQRWRTVELGGRYGPVTRTFLSRVNGDRAIDANLPRRDGSIIHLWEVHWGLNQKWIRQ